MRISPRLYSISPFLFRIPAVVEIVDGDPKHVCEKLMRNLERVGVCAVCTDKQPAGKSLFKVVFCIASSRLHCLNELCLDIAQSQKLKVAAKAELSSRVLHLAAITVAGNLGVDAIQTHLCSHES